MKLKTSVEMCRLICYIIQKQGVENDFMLLFPMVKRRQCISGCIILYQNITLVHCLKTL